MGVSKNRETPQNGWFTMENPFKMDDLGGKPTIFGNIQIDIMILFLNGGPPRLRRRIKISLTIHRWQSRQLFSDRPFKKRNRNGVVTPRCNPNNIFGDLL